MAITVVNLTDTFDEWRVKTNTLGTNVGDLTTLVTSNKTTAVAALNELAALNANDIENVVEDTSPQLGGNLDLNSRDITGTGDINITGALTISGVLTALSIAGTVTGTTQSASNNSTYLATTAYVDAQVATEDQLSELNDVTITSIANDNILQYNSTSSVWENTALVAVSEDDATALAIALGG